MTRSAVTSAVARLTAALITTPLSGRVVALRKTGAGERIRKHASFLAIAGIVVCFSLWAALYIYRSSVVAVDGKRYFVLFDDAMISMRYAWNLSHGYGLVWNPGEYVEGYTNPLMTLVMSLATSLFDKSGAALAIQILGAVLMIVNAYLIMRVAEHLFSIELGKHAGLFRVLAFVCGLSYYPLAYWSLLGMETSLLAVLLSLGVLFALKYAQKPGLARALLLSTILGLAFLTRPDAAVFALPLLVYALLGQRRRVRAWHLPALVVPFVLIVALQEVFRWVYYGELLPNTYTLKMTGFPLLERIRNGADFVAPFLTEVWVVLVLASAAVLFDFRRGKLLLLASVFAAALLYQVWVGGDAWDRWRFLSPTMPLVLVLATREVFGFVMSVSGSASFRSYFMRDPIVPFRHVPGAVAVLAVLAMLLVINFRFLPHVTMREMPWEMKANERRVDAAVTLEELTTPDATIGRFGAGTVPYYTGRKAIDFLGKSDPHIARLAPNPSPPRPGHNKYDLEYSIQELKPTHAQSFSWYGDSVADWAKDEYVRVRYRGVAVNLLKDSKQVRWDEIYAAVEAGEASLETPE